MRSLWEVIATIAITAWAITLLVGLIEPYVPVLLLAAVVVIVTRIAIRHFRHW